MAVILYCAIVAMELLYNISTRRSVYEKTIQTITGRFAFGNAVADGGYVCVIGGGDGAAGTKRWRNKRHHGRLHMDA